MNAMRTIAIDDPGVCLSVMKADGLKTAEQIDVLFGVITFDDPRSKVLDGDPGFPKSRGR